MVTIIVPVFNKQKVLKKCVDSITEQTYRDIEIILIDDGSTDDSWKICEELARQNGKIRVFHKENGGVSSARNLGIQEARGKYIQFVDADDYLFPTITENLVEAIEDNNAELVICGYEQIKQGKSVVFAPERVDRCMVGELGSHVKGLFKYFFINSPWNKLYLRDKIREGFPEDLSLGEDLTFNLRYMENINYVTVLNKALYYYINDDTGNSLSHNKRSEVIDIKERLFKSSVQFCRSYMNSEDAIADISNIFMLNIMYTLCDVYKNKNISRKDKDNYIKKWIGKDSVQLASRNCRFGTRQRKISAYLIRKRWAFPLEIIFYLKGKVL